MHDWSYPGLLLGQTLRVFIRALVVQGEHSRVEDSPFLSSSYDFTTEENGHPWFSDAWKVVVPHLPPLQVFTSPIFMVRSREIASRLSYISTGYQFFSVR